MPGRSRTLPVPYFVQPTSVTCQSTCLRMFAAYLERFVVYQSTGAGERDIPEIWKDINRDPARPVPVRNAHANMKWWLERHFPSIRFTYATTTEVDQAVESIVGAVDGGFPVMVSVSHARVPGHIILIVGYEGYMPAMTSPDLRLVAHDPYGQFDPSLGSTLFGRQRFRGGSSLASGGQDAPGRNVRIPVEAAGRQRRRDRRIGTYYLLSATR